MWLSLIGLFFFAAVVGIGFWLVTREEQVAPDDSAASICCNSFTCPDGRWAGEDYGYNPRANPEPPFTGDCNDRWREFCGVDSPPISQGNECESLPGDDCGGPGQPCCDADGQAPWDHGCGTALQCLDASGNNQAGDNEQGTCGYIGGTECQGTPTCNNNGCTCENSENCSYQTAEFNCPFNTDVQNQIPVSCNDANGSSGSGRGYCVTMQYDVTGCRGTNANVVWIDADGTRCSSNDASQAGASDYLGWCLQRDDFDISACAPHVPACGDGTVDPGEACDPLAVNTCEFGACNSNCTCPQEPPPSCGNGVVDTDQGEECDTAAINTCDYGACQDDCLCPDPNPGWEIEKVGTPSCSATADPYADVAYEIVVTNNGTTAGTLETVVDELDPVVQPDWILVNTISPQGTVNGNTITWTVNQPMAVGATLTFRYSLRVPRSAFGTIENTVTGNPTEGDSFTATETVPVSCTTPTTGIFESTSSKITAGVIMVIVSVAYLAFDRFDIVSVNAVNSVGGGLNKKFGKEAKVSKSRKKFEKDW